MEKLEQSIPEAKAVPSACSTPAILHTTLRELFHRELSFPDNMARIMEVTMRSAFSQEARLHAKHCHSGAKEATCGGTHTKAHRTLCFSFPSFLHKCVQELFNVNISL